MRSLWGSGDQEEGKLGLFRGLCRGIGLVGVQWIGIRYYLKGRVSQFFFILLLVPLGMIYGGKKSKRLVRT